MSQERIWDYFQGEGIANFDDAIPRLRYLVHKAARHVSSFSPSVLNIGVGNGWLERECLGRGWRVSALDPDASAIRELAIEGMDAQVGYIEKIPFKSGVFDVVFCSEVLEHLTDSQLETGRSEIARVLKPGGWLIGTVPYDENLQDGLVVCPDCGKRFHRWGHHQSFDVPRMSNFLMQGGFQPKSVVTYAFPVSRPNRFLNGGRQALRWLLGRFGSSHVYCNILFMGMKTDD